MAGYKKPPKHSQFKKGKSGNPKGRPKGSKNNNSMQELLEKELNSELQLADGNIITKKHAAVKNFTNTIVKTDKPHEAARGLEIIHKMESEDKDIIRARQFVAKILKDDFLNEDDIDDFIKGRKDPKFNYPKSVNKLYNKEKVKDIKAFEAVRKNQILAEFYSLIETERSLNTLINTVKNDLEFWEYVDANILQAFNLNQDQVEDITNILDNTRCFAKSDNKVLTGLYRYWISTRSNLDYYLFSTRDYLKESSYYSENEDLYFGRDDEFVEKVMQKECPDLTKDECTETLTNLKNKYDNFISIDNDFEYIDKDTCIGDVKSELYMWLNTENKETISMEGALKQINKKYNLNLKLEMFYPYL